MNLQTVRRTFAAVFWLALVGSCLAQSPNKVVPQPELDRGISPDVQPRFLGCARHVPRYQKTRPDDPLGFVADAAAYLFAEFDRLQILESDLFIDDHGSTIAPTQTPDPAVKAAFEAELTPRATSS